MGKAPSLKRTMIVYGEDTAQAWLMAQIVNLNDFCGVKQKMTYEQMEECARIFITDYSQLKLTELMLFFHNVKKGTYGTFFGVVDAQKLLAMMYDFMDYRSDKLDEYLRKGMIRE